MSSTNPLSISSCAKYVRRRPIRLNADLRENSPRSSMTWADAGEEVAGEGRERYARGQFDDGKTPGSTSDPISEGFTEWTAKSQAINANARSRPTGWVSARRLPTGSRRT